MVDNKNTNNDPEPAPGKSGKQILITGIAIVVLVLLVKFVFMGNRGALGDAEEGIDLLKQEKFAEAEEKFQEAITSSPEMDFTTAVDEKNLLNIGLANLRLENGDLEGASLYYEKAYDIDTSGFDRYSKFVRDDFHFPENAYLELGNRFWSFNNLDLAEKAYRRALAINPNYASALTNLGNVVRRRGETDQALQLYQKALIVDPELFEARVNLLNLAISSGKNSLIDMNLKKLKEYYPDSDYTTYLTAEQKKIQGDCKDAVALFEKFLEKNPGHQNAKLSLIDCSLEVGDYDRAQELLKDLAMREGNNPRLKERALDPAEKAFKEGDYAKAKQYYESMSAIYPNDPEFRFGEANAMINLGELSEARVILEDLVHDYPESSKIISNLGLVYAKMGKPEWAREQFEAAIAIDSPAIAYYNLGRIFEQEGDTAQANSCYILASLKEPEMFGLQDYMMEIKMEKAERIARGDTAGMIFLHHGEDSTSR